MGHAARWPRSSSALNRNQTGDDPLASLSSGVGANRQTREQTDSRSDSRPSAQSQHSPTDPAPPARTPRPCSYRPARPTPQRDSVLGFPSPGRPCRVRAAGRTQGPARRCRTGLGAPGRVDRAGSGRGHARTRQADSPHRLTDSRAPRGGGGVRAVPPPPARKGRPLAARALGARASPGGGGGVRSAYLRAQRRRAAHSLPAAMFPLRRERERTREGGGRAAGGSTEAVAEAGAGRGLPGAAPRASRRGVARASAVGPARRAGRAGGEGAAVRSRPASPGRLPPSAQGPGSAPRRAVRAATHALVD